MRILGLALLMLLFSKNSYSQIHAITHMGDEVMLYDDGSWKYVNDSSSNILKEIKLNDTKFSKSKNSGFLVKSNKLKVGVWINSKKWRFNKAQSNEAAEYEFKNISEDMYGLIITERLEIPYETLKLAAVENAKNVAPDIEIMQEEYRIVNGTKVLMLQMQGTYQGIGVVYFGYYLSNESGSTQFLTYTSKNLFKEYSAEMEELLNGFVELE